MKLQETIEVNKKILALIKSKYLTPESLWPTSPESRYYKHLLEDTQKAEEALKHGGLTPAADKEQRKEVT